MAPGWQQYIICRFAVRLGQRKTTQAAICFGRTFAAPKFAMGRFLHRKRTYCPHHIGTGNRCQVRSTVYPSSSVRYPTSRRRRKEGHTRIRHVRGFKIRPSENGASWYLWFALVFIHESSEPKNPCSFFENFDGQLHCCPLTICDCKNSFDLIYNEKFRLYEFWYDVV